MKHLFKISPLFFLIWFSLWLLPLSSQVFTVKDLTSLKPLELVTVSSEQKQNFAITNQKGQADISGFKGADNIAVRLLGYKTEVISYRQLENKKFILYLEQTNITINEVVVSATRWEQEKKNIPSKITIIRKDNILLQNPQTAADLLGLSGEVHIQKSQLGGGSPMIRGFATNRVLLTVDGVRMNTAIFRGGNVQNVISLDPLSIETTEILFGPGAVMYGSDAIGGAMNFYTLTPRFSFEKKPFVAGSIFASHSTANSSITEHFDLNIGLKKLTFVTSATYNDFDDLKQGSHGPDDYLRPEYVVQIDGKDIIMSNRDPKVQCPSGYNQLNLMQKVRFAPDEKLDFQYGFHYSTTSDYPRYDKLTEYKNDKPKEAEWYYGPQIWMMNALNIIYKSDNQLYNNLRITLAQQHFEESRHTRKFEKSILTHRTEKVDAYSVNFDLDKKTSEKQTLLYGAELVINHTGSFAEDENIKTNEVKPTSTRYPNDSKWNSIAGYINYLNKLSEKLTLQSGLRYSQVIIYAPFDTTFLPFSFTEATINTGALTGSAGIAYRPTEQWRFNFNLSTGFRAPNIDDIGKVFDSAPGMVVVPNPDLKSEYAYNAEVGVARIFGDFLKFDVAGYYTILQNAMVRRDFQFNGQDSILYDGEMSEVVAIQNAASAYVYGTQTAVEVKLPGGFSLNSRFTCQKGEEELDDGSKDPLRHAAPWFGRTHLIYGRNKLKADFYAIYQGEVSNKNLAYEEQDKVHMYALDADGKPYSPQWFTLNFKLMYQITDYFMANAGVENITDVRYRPYASGISAPGRNFVFSFRVSF